MATEKLKSDGALGSTKILPCRCESDYQDDKYSFGHRVHNRWKKGWRCTVCGRESQQYSISEGQNQ